MNYRHLSTLEEGKSPFFCTHQYSVRGSMKLPLVIEVSGKMVNAIEKGAHRIVFNGKQKHQGSDCFLIGSLSSYYYSRSRLVHVLSHMIHSHIRKQARRKCSYISVWESADVFCYTLAFPAYGMGVTALRRVTLSLSCRSTHLTFTKSADLLARLFWNQQQHVSSVASSSVMKCLLSCDQMVHIIPPPPLQYLPG